MLTLRKQRSYCGRVVRVYWLGLDLSFVFVGKIFAGGKKGKQPLLHLGKQNLICEYDLSTSTAGVSPSTSVDSGSDSCRQPVSAVCAGDVSVVSKNVSSQPTMSDGNPPVVDVSTL